MHDFLANADMVSGEMQQKNVKVKEHFQSLAIFDRVIFFSTKILMVFFSLFFPFFFYTK